MEGLILFWLLCGYLVKNVAEDTYHSVKGTPNPRHAARKRRAKTRARSRTWGAVTTYWGDLVEDAAAAATEHRRAKAVEKARRRQETEPVDAVVVSTDPAPARPRVREPFDAEATQPVDIALDDPKEDQTPEEHTEEAGSETPSPASDPISISNVIPFRAPGAHTTKENHMSTSTEVTGLDPAVAYADALAKYAGEHGSAGNEGYIGFLQSSHVQGAAIQTAHEMQEAFAAAQATAEKHKQELEKQKTVQEAYGQNPDAGDKQFMQNGQ